MSRATGGRAPEGVRTGSTTIFWTAVRFGVLAGVGEDVVLAFGWGVLRQPPFLNPHFFWMVPLADLILFAAAGALLALSARCCPVLVPPRAARVALAFVCFASILLKMRFLATWSALVLALALALRLAFPIERVLVGAAGWIRRRLAVLVSSLTGAAAAAALVGAPLVAPRAEPADRPRPNVLLVVLDTVRAASMSLYGHDRPTTPHLEVFAARGVVFETALATAPWTLPSHASMFTGRFPSELTTNWATPLDATHPTLAEALTARGYATAGIVANVGYCNDQTGLARGFTHYDGFGPSMDLLFQGSTFGRMVAQRLRSWLGDHEIPGRKSAAAINAAFFAWLSRQDRPFFAFLNYFDAHKPYLPPAPFDRRFGPKPASPEIDSTVPDRYTAAEVAALRGQYEGAIAHLDHHLDRLLAGLRERGLLDDTLVIVTSDHGEEFAEHGCMTHACSVYLPSIHVPLVMVLPGRIPAGRSVGAPVGLRDLPATVLDLVGLGADAAAFPGASLARHWTDHWTGAPAAGEPALSELRGPHGRYRPPAWWPMARGNMRSLVFDHHHYIRNGDGSEELYDLDQDPWEERDLGRAGEARRALERGRRLLDDMQLGPWR